MRVTRGSLAADGIVMWSTNGRCGVRFSCSLDVSEWIAPVANRQQNRIDNAFAGLKLGTAPAAEPAAAPSGPLPGLDELACDIRELALLI